MPTSGVVFLQINFMASPVIHQDLLSVHWMIDPVTGTVLRTDSPPRPFHNVLVTDRRAAIILHIWLFGLSELFGPPQIVNGFNAEGLLVRVPTCYEVCVLTDCFSCWLVAVKSKLAVTASVHVYSIQKAMLKDSGPLFNTDYDILKSNLQNCSKWAPECSLWASLRIDFVRCLHSGCLFRVNAKSSKTPFILQ